MNNTEGYVSKNTKPGSSTPGKRTASPGDTSQRIVRTKSPPIESVSQLISQIYAGTFKRKRLRKTDMDSMRSKPDLSNDEIASLVNQTSKDRLLKRTLHLITIGAKIESSKVTDEIGKFVHETLKKHPAFRVSQLNGPVDNVIHFISDHRNYQNLNWHDGDSKLTGREIKECRTNTVNCYLMWLWMTKKTSIARVQDYLLKYLWKPSAQPSKTDADKIILLTRTRNPETLAISTAVLHKDATDQKQRAESALIANEHSLKQVRVLENKLDSVQSVLSDTQKEADSLRMKLEKEHQEHANDNAHLKDDYETLRGQILRRLNAELALLEEGLHALRRNPPKVNVMVDHAERAIEGLRTELERLQKRGEN